MKAIEKISTFIFGTPTGIKRTYPFNMYDYKTNTFWVWGEDIYEFNHQADEILEDQDDPKLLLTNLEQMKEMDYIPRDCEIRFVPYYNWDDYYNCLENKTRKC